MFFQKTILLFLLFHVAGCSNSKFGSNKKIASGLSDSQGGQTDTVDQDQNVDQDQVVDNGASNNTSNDLTAFTVVGLQNDLLRLSGQNLNQIQSAQLVNKTTNQSSSLVVSSATTGQAFLKGLSGTIELVLGTAYSLIITTAHGATLTQNLNFSIVDGSVTANKLSTSGAQAGDILQFNGTSWAPARISMKALPGTSGLEVANSTSAAVPTKISASFAILTNSVGNATQHSNIALNANISNSGLNGLDVGSVAAGTWYYLYLISNGSTVASLFSLSSINPTLPAGYTYSVLISALRTNANSKVLDTIQIGKVVQYDTFQRALSTGLATSYTAVDLSSLVPPISKAVELMVKCYHYSSGNDHGTCTVNATAGSSTYFAATGGYWGNATVYEQVETPVQINLREAQKVYYKIIISSGYSTIQEFIEVMGYQIPGNLN